MDGIVLISSRILKITVKLLRDLVIDCGQTGHGILISVKMSSMMIIDIIYEKLFSCVIF